MVTVLRGWTRHSCVGGEQEPGPVPGGPAGRPSQKAGVLCWSEHGCPITAEVKEPRPQRTQPWGGSTGHGSPADSVGRGAQARGGLRVGSSRGPQAGWCRGSVGSRLCDRGGAANGPACSSRPHPWRTRGLRAALCPPTHPVCARSVLRTGASPGARGPAWGFTGRTGLRHFEVAVPGYRT